MANESRRTAHGLDRLGGAEQARLPLDKGGFLDVLTFRTPVAGGTAERIAAFLEAAFGAGDFSVRKTLSGEYEGSSSNCFLVAEIAGELVGSSWFMQANENPAIGVFGEVFTAPAQRGKGIALHLTRAAVSGFTGLGGRALYLATENPVAARVYERAGFETYTGNVMRCLSEPDPGFDEALFAPCDEPQARLATWGDLPRVVALCVYPHPWLICNYGLQRICSRHRRQDRCVSHYYPMWKPMEDGTGVLAVLETPDRRIVGVATLSASGALSQQGTGSFDFLVHENTLAQAGKLVDFTLRSAPAAIQEVTACFAEVDREKVEIARRAGFCKEAMLPEGLTVGSKTFDVARYSRQLQRGV